MSHQAPQGSSFLGSRYQDCIQLMSARSTNNTAVALDDLICANPDKPFTELNALSGIVQMGPADGLLLFPLCAGADTNQCTVFISRYDPVQASDGRVAGWAQSVLAGFLCTVGALAVGADLATLISGVLATDLGIKTVAYAGTSSQWSFFQGGVTTQPSGAFFHTAPGGVISPARNGFVVPVFGAPVVRIQTLIGTATNVLVIGRRVQGMWSAPAR